MIAERIAENIRETLAALTERKPLRPGAPDGREPHYDSYALGTLTVLAAQAAYLLDPRKGEPA